MLISFVKEKNSLKYFLYEGTIQAEDAPMFIRRWLVTARKDQAGWRVSNFTEYPD